MTSFVVDASVALKWLVAEEGTDLAAQLLPAQLTAPDLLLAECANACWRKARAGEMSLVEAQMASRILARLGLRLPPAQPLIEDAMHLALMLDHPVHDCPYLAAARAEQAQLVTADVRLLRRVRGMSSSALQDLVLGLEEAAHRLIG